MNDSTNQTNPQVDGQGAADVAQGHMPGDVPSFPIEVLPKQMREHAKATTAAMRRPVEMVAVPMLATAASAIGTTAVLRVSPDHVERAPVWTAGPADPSERKTPLMNAATQPAVAYANEHLDSAAYLSDATPQAFLLAMRDDPRGAFLVADELAGFARDLNAFGAGRELLAKIYSGMPIRKRLVKANLDIRVRQPGLTIAGVLPLDSLPDLDSPGRSDGFILRFLFYLPAPGEFHVTRADETGGSQSYAGWQTLYDALRNETWAEADAQRGTYTPQVLTLDDEAAQVWDSEANRLERYVNNATRGRMPRQYAAKLDGKVGQLALILHLCRLAARETQSKQVDGTSMRGAWQLGWYFLGQWERICELLYDGPLTTSSAPQDDAEWVAARLGELLPGGGFRVLDMNGKKLPDYNIVSLTEPDIPEYRLEAFSYVATSPAHGVPAFYDWKHGKLYVPAESLRGKFAEVARRQGSASRRFNGTTSFVRWLAGLGAIDAYPRAGDSQRHTDHKRHEGERYTCVVFPLSATLRGLGAGLGVGLGAGSTSGFTPDERSKQQTKTQDGSRKAATEAGPQSGPQSGPQLSEVDNGVIARNGHTGVRQPFLTGQDDQAYDPERYAERYGVKPEIMGTGADEGDAGDAGDAVVRHLMASGQLRLISEGDER